MLNENDAQNAKVAIVATDFEQNIKAQQTMKIIKQEPQREIKKEEKPIPKEAPQDVEELPAYLRRKRKV